MKKEPDYIKDIAEIRSMMERSTKFLSLSGWAGIMAGMYALAGAWVVRNVYGFQPDEIFYRPDDFNNVMIVASLVLILALFSAVCFSKINAHKRGDKIWTATSRRLLVHMAVPLVAGGLLILLFISKGLIGLAAPMSLLFYGLALYNAGKFTIPEVKFLGLVQIGLGLVSTLYIEMGLLCWAVGFGVFHILYGTYMYIRYER